MSLRHPLACSVHRWITCWWVSTAVCWLVILESTWQSMCCSKPQALLFPSVQQLAGQGINTRLSWQGMQSSCIAGYAKVSSTKASDHTRRLCACVAGISVISYPDSAFIKLCTKQLDVLGILWSQIFTNEYKKQIVLMSSVSNHRREQINDVSVLNFRFLHSSICAKLYPFKDEHKIIQLQWSLWCVCTKYFVEQGCWQYPELQLTAILAPHHKLDALNLQSCATDCHLSRSKTKCFLGMLL